MHTDQTITKCSQFVFSIARFEAWRRPHDREHREKQAHANQAARPGAALRCGAAQAESGGEGGSENGPLEGKDCWKR
eukprot:6183971-Pleurochrysis_carterae.AAC.4